MANDDFLLIEREILEDWAISFREQGMGHIGNIIRNSDSISSFPNFFTHLDEKRVGLEVTELTASDKTNVEWNRELFRQALANSIEDKEKEARGPTREKRLDQLDQIILVVLTDRTAHAHGASQLEPENIEKYLRHILVPKPSLIDRVFVLGPGEAEKNAHIRGWKPASRPARTGYTATEVHLADT